MKLKFDAHQQYQIDAVNSIVNIFEGLPQGQNDLSLDIKGETELLSELGIGNTMTLQPDKMLCNVREIQKRNMLPESPQINIEDYSFPNFTIEMETGTGKTYVYLRTILELNKKYGYKKFIIVVPSVAIREGTLKNLEITKSHFKDIYDNILFDYFVYNSKKPGMVRKFATSNTIQIMVINIDSFKRDVKSLEDEKKANLFHREADRLSGRAPKEYIASLCPIVILDEPQSIDNSDGGKKAIKSLNPLFVLRYSATHREVHNLMYRLDPVRAFELGLVKKIVVASVLDEANFNGAYIKLLDLDNTNGIRAKVEYHEDSGIARYAVRQKWVKNSTDLFYLSNEREEYRSGYVISEISLTEDGDGFIRFSDGRKLNKGESFGGMTKEVRRIQIRETIREHLEKEKQLKQLGIKVLSLFFVDRVSKYRFYDELGNPQKGEYAVWFEEEFNALSQLDEFKGVIPLEVAKIHDGYFSQDKQGRLTDTSGVTELDISTYDKIMKNKEQLLSFREPLRFIFSHSALREGWDNPNVFQICTLNDTNAEIKKRQEIGRGLRIPVNQDGERIFDDNINKLVIVANEHYEDFARKLQQEYIDEGVEFGIVQIEKLKSVFRDENSDIASGKAVRLHDELLTRGYLNAEFKVTELFIKSVEDKTVSLSSEFENTIIKYRVIEVLQRHQLDSLIRKKVTRKPVRVNTKVIHDEAFISLWEKINKKTAYSVTFSSEDLIVSASRSVSEMSQIKRSQIQFIKVNMPVDSQGVVSSEFVNRIIDVGFSYEIPDTISYIQRETELTRSTICDILIRSGRINDVKINPQFFLDEVVRIIQNELSNLIIDGIKYEIIDGQVYEMQLFENIEIAEEIMHYVNSDKSPYDFMVLDSYVEKEYANKLNEDASVKFYTKLPKRFVVDTPIGTYNPDWALLKEDNGLKLYLVRETKGSVDKDNRRGSENKKIKCAEKHFKALGVDYKDIQPPFTQIS